MLVGLHVLTVAVVLCVVAVGLYYALVEAMFVDEVLMPSPPQRLKPVGEPSAEVSAKALEVCWAPDFLP